MRKPWRWSLAAMLALIAGLWFLTLPAIDVESVQAAQGEPEFPVAERSRARLCRKRQRWR